MNSSSFFDFFPLPDDVHSTQQLRNQVDPVDPGPRRAIFLDELDSQVAMIHSVGNINGALLGM
jgi:hypothetical protein